MPPINFASAIAVSLAFLLVARAFWPLIAATITPFAYRMMRGALVVSAALILRANYWDVLPYIVGDEWAHLRDALGGQNISSVFNAMMLWAAYDFLNARLFLIPEEDRDRWHWWNAWHHPSSACLARRKPK